MSILEAAKYITNGNMEVSIDGPILYCEGIRQLSFTGRFTDTASPVGELQVWGTDDPRARDDQMRGLSQSAGQAQWHQCDLPTGSAKVSAGGAVTADDIGLDGTAAGTFTINVTEVYAFMRLRWVRTGGGAADLLNVNRAGRSD